MRFIELILAMSPIIAIAVGLSSAVAEPTDRRPLAEVNGQVITSKELDDALGTKLSRLEEQIYTLKRQHLDALIAERLLVQEADKRGVSVEVLLDAEVAAKSELVTEQEIDAFYRANKGRVPGDEATARQRIQTHLQEQKLAARHDAFVESLRSKATVVVRLQRPPVVRTAVSTDGAPARGAAGAPVTIVEFSDYHCPFCKRAQTTVKQLLERYPGKVRHVFRDFPIDSIHPQARQASEAARCAQDQGKFWEYHELLFTHAPKGSPDDMRRYAAEVGLAAPAFEACLAARSHRATVQRDIDEGKRLGINGTPAFFINGRPLHGAQPLEAFAQVIEEELAPPKP